MDQAHMPHVDHQVREVQSLRVLLVGQRRMSELAGYLKQVAPHAEFVLVSTASEGEPYLDGTDVVIMADRVTDRYLSAPRLRWMHLYPTGVDHVTIPALREARFVMTHKVQASVIPMAEHAMALLLAIARQLPAYRDLQRAGEWRHFSLPPATELRQLSGSTLGIVGLGNVGSAVARRARAFGMRVIGVKRAAGDRHPHVDAVLPPDRLRDVLAAADYVVILTPLTDQTHHLIDESALRAMKPTAHLINISRGAVVQEPALVRALQERRIAGAALDVFAEEPLSPTSPLWAMPNVILTPHVAGSGPDNARDAAQEITENLRRFLAGRPLRGTLRQADILTRQHVPRQ